MTLTDRQLAALRACLYKPHPNDAGDVPTAQEVLWTIHVGDDLWTLACDGYMALCLRTDQGEPPRITPDPGQMLTSLQRWIAASRPVLFTVSVEQARAWATGASICHSCGGAGKRPCTDCDGKGRVVREAKCEHCGHEHHCEYQCGCVDGQRDCWHCDGRGRPLPDNLEAEDRAGIIGDLVLDRERVGRLLAVAGVDVAVSLGDHQMSKQGLVSFSGDGWVAFLCPLNREYLEPTTPGAAPRLGPVPQAAGCLGHEQADETPAAEAAHA